MNDRLLNVNNLQEMNYQSLIWLSASWREFGLMITNIAKWFQKDDPAARRLNTIMGRIRQFFYKMRDYRMSVNLWSTHPNFLSAMQMLI